jgi:hypothetical protein
MTTAIHITSWLRAFFALQEAALDARGSIEIPDGDDGVFRWPRTHAGDVAAIATVLDPLLRELPLRFGGHGLARRWRASVDGLARHPCGAEYTSNRTFWRTLPAMCLYLHSRSVPLSPPDVWSALLARFDDRGAAAARTLA